MSQKIRKAVIPVAGFGTRMLPLSKAVPKELLPVNGLPVIHHVVKEAMEAGCTEVLFISRPGKRSVEDYFSPDQKLMDKLKAKDQLHLLDEWIALQENISFYSVDQVEQKGLGDAIACAKDFVGNEYFAVLLGDAILYSPTRSVLAQMTDIHRSKDASVIAVEEVPKEKISRYGIVGGKNIEPGIIHANQLIEKPGLSEAPSNLAIAARYLLSPTIFDLLAQTETGKGGEIQVTDALHKLAQKEKLMAFQFEGKRLDIGNPEDFLEANLFLRNQKTT